MTLDSGLPFARCACDHARGPSNVNIWLVNHYAVPPDQPGSTRHYSLARELVRGGHSVAIVASSHPQFGRTTLRDPAAASSVETYQDIPFLFLRSAPLTRTSAGRLRNMVSFAWRLWRGRDLARLPEPDVIVGSSPHPFAAFVAERLARRRKIPFVMEVRDLWPETIVQLGHYSRWHPVVALLAAIERYLYRHAAAIVTLLPHSHEHIASHGGQRERIHWIPNGIDFELAGDWSPAPPSHDGAFEILYTGAHGLANGLDVIVDAAAILAREGYENRIRFRLIGEGPEKAQLQRRVNDEQLAGLVTFEPAVSKERLHEVMRSAGAFCLPLRDSSVFQHGVSPNKMFDYLAIGRPIIFAVGSVYNPVRDAGAGITILPSDPAALAQAARTLFETSPDERTAMGMRGRRHVEERFGFEQLGGQYLDVLCGALSVRTVVPRTSASK